MLKTLSPRTSELLRQFFPLPQSERLEEDLGEEIDCNGEVIADVELAAKGLMWYGS
jgi:hypothetical protein